jgi:hypothetical protein
MNTRKDWQRAQQQDHHQRNSGGLGALNVERLVGAFCVEPLLAHVLEH